MQADSDSNSDSNSKRQKTEDTHQHSTLQEQLFFHELTAEEAEKDTLFVHDERYPGKESVVKRDQTDTPIWCQLAQKNENIRMCRGGRRFIDAFLEEPTQENWEELIDGVFCQLYEGYVTIPTFGRMHELARSDATCDGSPVAALSDRDLAAALREERMSPAIFASVLLWLANQSDGPV
tara:strand:+ start:191 stop:727 length:537 start_codon:yes stop_codon:yes gene_type:complete